MRRMTWIYGVMGLALAAGNAGAAVVILDDFEGAKGHFGNDPDFSGTTTGQTTTAAGVGPSVANLDTTTAVSGVSSIQVFMDDNTAADVPSSTDDWRLRFLSGGGTPANNTTITNPGYVGYWLKTSSQGIRASIMIDDGAALEVARKQAITADGDWHLYQWNLADAADWDPFAGTGPNGAIDAASVTIDSIFVDAVDAGGAKHDATFNIDAVSFSDSGPIPAPEPGTLGLIAVAGGMMLRRRRA